MIIVRLNEILLKSRKVRQKFMRILIRNMRLKNIKNIRIVQSRIYCEGDVGVFKKIFGVESVSEAIECDYNLDRIVEIIKNIAKEKELDVDVQRVTKDFPMISPEIANYIRRKLKESGFKINFKSNYRIGVEFNSGKTYIFDNIIKCFGGLPVGVSGKVLALLSGGIDSPVASLLMMKRGCEVDFIHFKILEEDYNKVLKLFNYLKEFCPNSKMYVVNYKPILEKIKENFCESYRCFICKYCMYYISSKYGLPLVTGDNLGQVASQTLDMLNFYSRRFLIYRPLIGFNKQEIVDLAKEFGTYELSIKPNTACPYSARKPIVKPVNIDLDSFVKNLEYGIKVVY
jgi:thiamine biosynthesis protein ThiI